MNYKLPRSLRKNLPLQKYIFGGVCVVVCCLFLFVFVFKLELRASSKLVRVSSSLPSSSVLKIVEVSDYYLETSTLY